MQLHTIHYFQTVVWLFESKNLVFLRIHFSGIDGPGFSRRSGRGAKTWPATSAHSPLSADLDCRLVFRKIVIFWWNCHIYLNVQQVITWTGQFAVRRRPVHTPTDHFDTFHQLTRFPPHTSFAYQRICSTKVKHLMANLCSIAFMVGCGGCEMQCLLYSDDIEQCLLALQYTKTKEVNIESSMTSLP